MVRWVVGSKTGRCWSGQAEDTAVGTRSRDVGQTDPRARCLYLRVPGEESGTASSPGVQRVEGVAIDELVRPFAEEVL